MPTQVKPYSPSARDLKSYWHVVDAADQVLGRMASEIAVKLMGKHRADYVPHMASGDFVVVVNAEKVRVTGKKAEQKVYRRHSGYPGNLKEIPYARWKEHVPERIIEHAVRGMLPKNRLGNRLIRRLKVYAGPEHPHEAQLTGSERALAELDPLPTLDEIDQLLEEQMARLAEAAKKQKKAAKKAAKSRKRQRKQDEAVAAPEEVEATAESEADDADDSDADAEEAVADQLPADDVDAAEDVTDADDDADAGAADAAVSESTSLADLGIAARIVSLLAADGVSTVGDAIGKTDEELLAVKGIGARALEDLRSALSEAGVAKE